MGPLHGIKVIDLSRLLPGPYCSMILSDHGAEVLSIEGRQYQTDDLFFTDLYRNKDHMTLNLKSEKGKEILYELVADADVVLEGFRPGVAARLRVDFDTLCHYNSRLIYCSISGYGQYGPMQNRAGHDVNYLSRSGVLDLIGEKDGPPVIPAVQIADITGAYNAVIGILLALVEREKSGKGQYVDISMTDALLGYLTIPYLLQTTRGHKAKRSSTLFSHRFACYNTYETADGKYIALGAVEPKFWEKLCDKVGMQEYKGLQYDEDNREEIIAAFRSLFLSSPLHHWDNMLADADVCYSAVAALDDVLEDSLFTERDMIPIHGDDTGKRKTLGIPVKLSRTPGTLRKPPMKFGEATRSVLADMGYSKEAIDELYRVGVL